MTNPLLILLGKEKLPESSARCYRRDFWVFSKGKKKLSEEGRTLVTRAAKEGC